MPEQLLWMLKPDICWSSLSNHIKTQSVVGAVTFFSAGVALSPGSSLFYKTSDTKAPNRYWRKAICFLRKHSAKSGRGTFTDQDEMQSWDRHHRWQTSSVVGSMLGQGVASFSPEDSRNKTVNKRVAYLSCRYQSLWKSLLTRMQTRVYWRHEQHHMHSLVPPSTGNSCYRRAEDVWVPFKEPLHSTNKQTAFEGRILNHIYIVLLVYGIKGSLKLLIYWLSNSRDQKCQIWPPWVYFLE